MQCLNSNHMNNEVLRKHLLALQDAIQQNVIDQQADTAQEDLAQLAEVTAADAIYQIDKISEHFVLNWFGENWPQECPVELIMEGIEDGTSVFPEGTPMQDLRHTCILDPIDGTRGFVRGVPLYATLLAVDQLILNYPHVRTLW